MGTQASLRDLPAVDRLLAHECWTEAEAALSGRFEAGALEGLTLGSDDMIIDLHGSGAYRAHLCGVMTRRAVAAIA